MADERPHLRYRDAGVNIDAAETALSLAKESIRRTFDENVLEDVGNFGAMYRFPGKGMDEPVLVSSIDGVGTKLKLAFMTGIHDTVGVDLVSHCVNDILVQGAQPMFFLDYLAFGKLDPKVVEEVIRGLATGCRYANCALIGGETAEMPGLYDEGEYDLAGTIVGIVDRANIVDGATIEEGDVVVGLHSSGLHTNGYSLARKICFEVAGLAVNDPLPGTDTTVAKALMEPHRNYANVIKIVRRITTIKGMAHITGGGLTDNLPRCMPDGLGATLRVGSWPVPPLFKFLQKKGNVEDAEMLRSFNCGIGFAVIVAADEADNAMDAFSQALERPKLIGRIVKNGGIVEYEGSLADAG